MNYFWDDQFHLYRTKNPGEFSYSDGVGVEERLLSVVSKARDRSTLSQEIADSICDWPSEYHFSRSRHCLVRPLELHSSDKVLELGCGCGAITRYLGEIGAQVVAVEGSLARARVAAERCRDLTNVRVVADDLLRFETDERFVCILLIGVLEYAALFSGREQPFEHYLQAVSRFLAPGGRVVIAIENKLGLKYFNGCGEDHVGVPFFGVQDLYGPGTARTFGRQELIALLSASGLSRLRFYYPFPDYKLPTVVLAENALTDPGFDAVDLLARCHARDYAGSPYRGFDEALAFSVLHTNGLLADLSNSFLVVATPDKGPPARATELAFAWSVNRAPEFCTQTIFVRVGSEIRVLKKLLTASVIGRRTVDESLTITHQLSESVYRPGRQLLWDLLRARAAGGDVESIVQALRPWMEFLLQRARVSPSQVAGASEELPRLSSYVLAGEFLDCTPFNLLQIDGDLVPIDDEWQSKNDVSLGWVITRGVLWSMCSGMSSGSLVPSLLELIEALCGSFHLAVSEADVETWLGAEAHFQKPALGHVCEPLATGRTFRGLRLFLSEISSLQQTLGQREAELDQVKVRTTLLSVELAKRTEQLNHVLQSRAWPTSEGRRAPCVEEPSKVHDDVFSYMSMPIDPLALPRRVAIGVSSKGNFFMAEIARMIEDAVRHLGVETRLFDDRDAGNLALDEMVIVVAPHEFFLLGDGPRLFEIFNTASNLVMFNTEQPQTPWFAAAMKYLSIATAVLDINYESAQYLAGSGLRSFFLPLGYSDYMVRNFDGCVLPEHELFKYKPASVLTPVPLSYSDRPIDILFVGTSSPRRSEFLAANAKFFASKDTFIYMPTGDEPFLSESPRTIDFATLVALVKRSKILLNIHRDPHPYLEWQRVVTLGVLQKTLVVSDHCEPGPCIEPNVDYLDGSLEALPALCDSALGNIEASEAIAHRAYEKLKSTCSMEQIVGRCFTALHKTIGAKQC